MPSTVRNSTTTNHVPFSSAVQTRVRDLKSGIPHDTGYRTVHGLQRGLVLCFRNRKFFLRDLWRLVAEYAVPQLVFLYGQDKEFGDERIACWDQDANQVLYTLLTPEVSGSDDGQMSIHKSRLYVLKGGVFLGSVNLAQTSCMRVENLPVPPANHIGGSMAILSESSSLYAIGGRNIFNRSWSNCMHRFDLLDSSGASGASGASGHLGHWDPKPLFIPFRGESFVATTISASQFIVTGGKDYDYADDDGEPRSIPYQCRLYDCTSDSWSELCNLPHRCWGHSAIFRKPTSDTPLGQVVVFSQHFSSETDYTWNLCDHVVQLDLCSKKWTYLPSLPDSSPLILTAFESNGQLYAVCMNKKHKEKRCLRLDDEQHSWHTTITTFPKDFDIVDWNQAVCRVN
jgi:hypothetical protein